MLVVASLNNAPFAYGYNIQNPRIADGQWREIFNSDAAVYGGSGLANQAPITSSRRCIERPNTGQQRAGFAEAGMIDLP